MEQNNDDSSYSTERLLLEVWVPGLSSPHLSFSTVYFTATKTTIPAFFLFLESTVGIGTFNHRLSLFIKANVS